MDDASGPIVAHEAEDGEDPLDDAPPPVRPVGSLLVAAALVFAAAVVASSAATVISIFDAESQNRSVELVHLAAQHGVTLLSAGLLVGAALLLVAAEFHDVDSPWFPRAVGIVGGLACIAVAAGLFVALDVPSWNQSADPMTQRFSPFSSSLSDRLVMALLGLSVAAIAACAAAACWMLATGRIDFGRARDAPRGEVDVPE